MSENTKAGAATPANATNLSSGDFTPVQLAALDKRGLTPETVRPGTLAIRNRSDLPEGCPDYWTINADEEGRAYLPGLLIPWRSPVTGVVEWQLRPDNPPLGEDGRPKKYVFRPGAESILHAAKVVDDPEQVEIVEGTFQTDMTALYAEDRTSVYGIAGCQSWMKNGLPTADLEVVDGLPVMITLDTDASTNRNVFDAGIRLREACLTQGATSVRFPRTPGTGKAGRDDWLATVRPERRAALLANLIQATRDGGKAMEKPADRRPEAKAERLAVDGELAESSQFFDARTGGLLAEQLTTAVLESSPCLLAADGSLALYQNGVYGQDGVAFSRAVARLLGDAFRGSHRAVVEEFARGLLNEQGKRLPMHSTEPLLNVANGLLNLRTGVFSEHTSDHRSSVQLPVEWDPGAICPRYERWLADQIPDQIEDLEECVGVMLDPSVTPTKAVFLYGPSRSGKSTFLRLMATMAGAANTSGVSLHMLSDKSDKFAAADLFGKVLNIDADVKAEHVADLSLFKKLTGQDVVMANRKYGGRFNFTNRALFAFSANELPTVSESSRAYSERIKPFRFGVSFAGREDPTVEAALEAELPGVLVRWVHAYRRRLERGSALVTNPAVREEFELESDRVRKWVAERMEIVSAREGQSVGSDQAITRTEAAAMFNEWANESNGPRMSQSKITARLLTLPGAANVRRKPNKAPALNFRMRRPNTWGVDSGVSGVDFEAPESTPGASESTPDKSDSPGPIGPPLTKSPDKTDTVRPSGVESVDFETPLSTREIKSFSEVDHGEKSISPDPHRDVSKSTLSTPDKTDPDPLAEPCNRADAILTEHSLNQHESFHRDWDGSGCGGPEVLVDGLWFSCPVCYPDTARLAEVTR